MMIFAEMPPPDAGAFMTWLGCAAFALMLANQTFSLVSKFRGHPAPEQLKSTADEMTRRVQELEHSSAEAVERRRKMHEKIEATDRALREHTNQITEGIYKRINLMGERVAGLVRDTENQNHHLVHIETKLDRLIERKLNNES